MAREEVGKEAGASAPGAGRRGGFSSVLLNTCHPDRPHPELHTFLIHSAFPEAKRPSPLTQEQPLSPPRMWLEGGLPVLCLG